MRRSALTLASILTLAGCSHAPAPAPVPPAAAFHPAAVNAARLAAAAADGANWMTYGRTYDEQRFSPLRQIDVDNVAHLKLAWHYDLPVAARAQESTPLVIDGVMYVTGAFSKVFALDARTGTLKWSYDPQVAMSTDINTCCDAVNRGVAAWNGKLYLGTLDGRLIALDAATGRPVWEVRTTPSGSRYTITGAPRVVKAKVIIGNAGGEMGVRGYVSAYDAETGELAWRFYTVPGAPGKPDGAASDAVLERLARPTWSGKWWTVGGGGTVWDSMAYDPKLDLLYIGTDNGGPWDRKFRSPRGGDNLFITSIIALKPDSGAYVWHFQTTPGDMWDYSAVQTLTLADLTIDGTLRHVIMQAPKNGFFYVLDRETGQLLSVHQYADTVNWAKGIDPKTGRPIVNRAADYSHSGKPASSNAPGPLGAHNWEPMAFSPATGYVYIPVSEMTFPYVPAKRLVWHELSWNIGLDLNAGSLPQNPVIVAAALKGLKGHLAAWDPVAQKEVWRVELGHPWNGGVLATAGNLVFEGNAMGELNAYRADSGARLWSAMTYTGILAPPVTYLADGKQYVAVEVGWGGAFGLAAGALALDSQIDRGNVPRVLGYALDGTDQLPPPPPPPERKLEPRPEIAPARVIARGKATYHQFCGTCHGDGAVAGGVLPDLRYSAAAGNAVLWSSIVHDGALQSAGMVAFGSELSAAEIESVRAYIVDRIDESAAFERTKRTRN